MLISCGDAIAQAENPHAIDVRTAPRMSCLRTQIPVILALDHVFACDGRLHVIVGGVGRHATVSTKGSQG